jgi:hypothetical protein
LGFPMDVSQGTSKPSPFVGGAKIKLPGSLKKEASPQDPGTRQLCTCWRDDVFL